MLPSTPSEMSTVLAENGTSVPAVTTANIIIGVLVEIVILLLILGNLLMVITLLLYKQWTIPDLLLFTLSFADLVNGTIPVHILNIMNNFHGRTRWSTGLCTLFIWLTFSLRMTSVCTITLISMERVILLTRPLKHRSIVTIKKGRIAVVIVLLFSAFVAALPFMGAGQSGFHDGYCHYQLYDLGIAFGITIETIGIIQLVIVLACFVMIKLSSGEFIKRQSVMVASNQTGNNTHMTAGTKQVKQLTKMMAIVVLLYYISWLPYLLTNFVSLFQGHLPHAVDIIVGFLSLVSAIINPLLYGKMSLRYRRGYLFVLRKIRSICGGERPDGSFFDDSRRGSYSSSYAATVKRRSLGTTVGLEVNQQVNRAYEEDEVNHNNNTKDDYHEDALEDDHDNDDIAIYPVEFNKKDDNDDGGDGDGGEHDETQISICPFNESVQFSGNEGELDNEATRGDDEDGDDAKPSTVDEEDFAICPYDESIVAHFEDLVKLAEEEDNNGGKTAGENVCEATVDQKLLLQENVNSVKGKSEEGINIPGAVLDQSDVNEHDINDDDDNGDDNGDDNDDDDGGDDHDDHDGDHDGDIYDGGNGVKNDDHDDSTPTTIVHKEALINQGSDSESQSETDSQNYSDASNSYGEGSIMGNYDITQPEQDSDEEEEEEEEDEGSTMGNYGIAQPEQDSDEDEDEKEEKEEGDNSSKASGEASYDIMEDLLEREKTSNDQQNSHGHFFVDDIVKRMEEDDRKRSSLDSYNLLSDEAELVDEKLPGDSMNLKDPVTAKGRGDKINTSSQDEEDVDREMEDENVNERELKGKSDEKEKRDESGMKVIDKEDKEGLNEYGEQQSEDDKGEKEGNQLHEEDDNKEDKTNDDLTHGDQEGGEPNFIVDESIFKGASSELSSKKKYTRKGSDLLRKELGEI